MTKFLVKAKTCTTIVLILMNFPKHADKLNEPWHVISNNVAFWQV